MRYAVYLPLLLSLLVAPPLVTAGVRTLPDRLHPRTVVVLLVTVMAGLAASAVASLVLLVVGGVVEVEHGAVSTPGGHTNPGGLLAGVLATVALAVAAVRLGRTVAHATLRRRLVRDRVVGGRDGAPWVVDDDAVYALAAPASRGRCGRVVLSRGLVDTLDRAERAAVVAHEAEHLAGRHHRYLVLGAVAAALNPALGPLRRDLGYALERCADEAAARCVADRAVVARAIGRAALAARRRPVSVAALERTLGLDAALLLGATGGPVPRRVEAMLTPSAAADGRHRFIASLVRCGPLALAVTVLIAGVAGLALLGALHAAVDLADIVATD